MASSLDRALAYLEKLDPAVSGAGGHNQTLRAACECFRFGLSEGEAWQALQWFNEMRCKPAWSERELRHKLADARKIVSQAGQAGARGQAYRSRRQSYVPPPAPVRRDKPKPPVPVYLRSAAEEEAWWQQLAPEEPPDALAPDEGYWDFIEQDAGLEAEL